MIELPRWLDWQKLPSEKKVFVLSLLILSAAGLGVVAITTFTKVSTSHRQLALTRALWKFESEANRRTIYEEKCWSWRKLVLAGIMVVSALTSMTSKFLDIPTSLKASTAMFGLWMVFLTSYWYFVVEDSFKKKTSTKEINEDNAYASPSVSEATAVANAAWLKRRLDRESREDSRLPLTIVTGFLGSGKTTLVKNILDNTVGMRVLVIENEIGAEGVDHELLMQHTAKEEIILMSNGCVCCTVRKDILQTFYRMFQHEAFAKLDWIVIETTGMADPAPLIQSLYMDADCAAKLRLDSVLTVVDCKHLPMHLSSKPTRHSSDTTGDRVGGTGMDPKNNIPDGVDPDVPIITSMKGMFQSLTSPSRTKQQKDLDAVPEAVLQITFADRILMNKTDLVSESELEALFTTVHSINPQAQLLACQHSQVPLEDLLNIRAFDPLQNQALVNVDTTNLSNSSDSAVNYAINATESSNTPVLIQMDEHGKILRRKMKFGENLNIARATGNSTNNSEYRKGNANKLANLSAANKRRKRQQQQKEEEGSSMSRHVSSGVQTKSLVTSSALDLDAFNKWISGLLAARGAEIYRLKGVLQMHGYEEQFLVHGVHMVFDGSRGPRWPPIAAATANTNTHTDPTSSSSSSSSSSSVSLSTVGSNPSSITNTKKSSERSTGRDDVSYIRKSKLVLIGLNLHEMDLEEGFQSCCVIQKTKERNNLGLQVEGKYFI